MTPGERKSGLGVCVAAGLLFGMTTLWLSVHPRGDPHDAARTASPAGAGRRADAFLEIRIVHDERCSDRLRAEKPCRQDSHWSVRLDGLAITDPDELRVALRREADRARSGLHNPATSERHVVIRGHESAPWGFVQRFMNECAKVGIYKIDWSILERGKSGPLLEAWLPAGTEFPGPDTVNLEEIRVFMKWDPGPEVTLRKVGNRGMVDSDEDLMNIILQMFRDYTKAGKFRPTVIIDAIPDVPWKDVIHVVELCRKENLESIEFAPPFYERTRAAKK